jgi:hypothetical protein
VFKSLRADGQYLWGLIIAAVLPWDVFSENRADLSCGYSLGLCVKYTRINTLFSYGATPPRGSGGPGPTDCRGFRITLIGHTTLGRTPLDE